MDSSKSKNSKQKTIETETLKDGSCFVTVKKPNSTTTYLYQREHIHYRNGKEYRTSTIYGKM